jgi:transcriptional regulator with XRE-family HTH domain
VEQNGSAIRSFRVIRGLSVSDLADRIGTSPQALRNYELEHRPLPLVRAERIAAELCVDLPSLLRETWPPAAAAVGEAPQRKSA